MQKAIGQNDQDMKAKIESAVGELKTAIDKTGATMNTAFDQVQAAAAAVAGQVEEIRNEVTRLGAETGMVKGQPDSLLAQQQQQQQTLQVWDVEFRNLTGQMKKDKEQVAMLLQAMRTAGPGMGPVSHVRGLLESKVWSGL